MTELGNLKDEFRGRLLALPVSPREPEVQQAPLQLSSSYSEKHSALISPEFVEKELSFYEEERLEDVDAQADAYAQDVVDYLDEIEEESELLIIDIRKKHYEAVIDRINKYQEEYRTMMTDIMGKHSILPEESVSVKLQAVEYKHKRQLEEEERVHQNQIRSKISLVRSEVESDLKIIQNLMSDASLQNSIFANLVLDTQQKVTIIVESINQILNLDKFSEKDIETAKIVASNSKKLLGGLPKKINDLKQDLEKLEAERKKNIPVEPEVMPPKPLKQTSSGEVNFIGDYIKQQMALRQFEENLKDFIDDPRNKSYRLNLQQFIRTNINAISTGSDDHLKQKYRNLCQLFDGRSITFQEKIIKCTEHPKALDFCMSFAAKTFISVGSKQVLSVPKAAFPMAAVIVLLWTKHPTFGSLFLSMIQEKCPFVGVFYPKREKDESETSHLISSGYVFGADNQTLESEESYLNRMRALIRMYGAVTASNVGPDHPHGIDKAWTWLARTCSTEPVAAISAAVIQAFLSVTFFRLHHVYKKQAIKILQFVAEQYLPRIELTSGKDVKKQSLVQLKMFVDETLVKVRRQQSLKPEGHIADYFWQKAFLNS